VSTVTKSQKCCHYANFLFFLKAEVFRMIRPTAYFCEVSVWVQHGWTVSTGADDGTLVLYLTNTQGDCWIFPQLLKFMWWIIQKLESFNLASRVSNLRVLSRAYWSCRSLHWYQLCHWLPQVERLQQETSLQPDKTLMQSAALSIIQQLHTLDAD